MNGEAVGPQQQEEYDVKVRFLKKSGSFKKGDESVFLEGPAKEMVEQGVVEIIG